MHMQFFLRLYGRYLVLISRWTFAIALLFYSLSFLISPYLIQVFTCPYTKVP